MRANDRCASSALGTVALALVVLCSMTVSPAVCQTDYTAGSDNKLLCMAEMVSNIENSCANPDSQRYYVALESLLKQYLGKCFQTNFTQNRALHIMLPNLDSDTPALDYTKELADAFKASTGVDVLPTFVPAGQINPEIEFELVHNLAYSHDGWVFDPQGISNIEQQKGFTDLTDIVANSTIIEWQDVHKHFREVGAVYDGRVVVLPLDGNMPLLYYRKDLFKKFNLTVPSTWDDMVSLALSMNNTDLDDDNSTTEYSICLETRRECHASLGDFLSVLAPFQQYKGTTQGVFFDPVIIGDPSQGSPMLLDPATLTAALNIYAKLTSVTYNRSSSWVESPKCDDPRRTAKMFANGQCLMTFGQGFIFKESQQPNSSVAGNVGVAVPPGSTRVYDRDAKALLACDRDRCPNAAPHTDAAGVTRLVNRAPFAAGGGWVSAINLRSKNEYQAFSVLFFSNLSSPEEAWTRVLNRKLDFDPYRYSHFSDLGRWVDAGFNAADTAQYLAAAKASFDSPNIALDLRVPGTPLFKDIYEAAVANATLGKAPDAVLSVMRASFNRLLGDSQKVNLAAVAEAYRLSIGYRAPYQPPAPPSPPSPRSKGGGSPSWLPIAIVLPTVGALLLIAAGVVYEVRNNRKHKNVFGKVIPPGLGPDTTILVTEVQDASALHEQLGSEVLDRVMREHNECLRRLLLKHSGYESALEGDSFVMAFHSPKDALLFALEAQVALLSPSLDWPAELLALPGCAPVFVQGILSTNTKSKALADILDASDDPLPAGASKIKALTPGLGAFDSPVGLTLPSLVNVPASETYTFATACQRAWKEAGKEDPSRVMLFRGLRLSIGLHAGVYNAGDISTTGRTDGRAAYSGDAVALARAVAQAAPGGTVLLSEETYKKLPLERLWDKYLVLHVGEHRLRDSMPHLNLYHALNRTLEGRLAYVGSIRSISQLDPGVLDAPVGCVTVAFQNVVGAQTLLSWNADVAQQAIKAFHTVVGEELKRRRGYLVEAVDGLFLAAFQRPSDAILWALECNEHMIRQDWPEELLGHELCEELVISAPTKEGEVVNTVVFRGLRLKTGVDTGQVLGEVHAMTGRMTYRGKVMNRAARVASTASTGQVLCSCDSWQLATTNDLQAMTANKVSGTSLGQFRLKGVAEKIEIYHCRKISNVAPARRASTLVMSMADPWGGKWGGGGAAGNGGVGAAGMGAAGDGQQPGGPMVSPDDVLLAGAGGGDVGLAAMHGMSPRSFSRNRGMGAAVGGEGGLGGRRGAGGEEDEEDDDDDGMVGDDTDGDEGLAPGLQIELGPALSNEVTDEEEEEEEEEEE